MNKLFTCFAIAVAFGAFAGAYDFNDELFNEILAKELEEGLDLLENDVFLHPRHRRDEEAVNTEKCRRWKPKDPKLCCGGEALKEKYEEDKDIRKECFKQVFGKEKDFRRPGNPFKCEKTDRHRKNMMCVFQCVLQKKNMINEDGSLIEDAVKQRSKSVLEKLEWFAPMSDEVTSKCISEAKMASANHDKSEVDSCNPESIKYMHCMFREVQLNCPADQIKDEKACMKLKDRLKKNDIFGPPPPNQSSSEEKMN